jgi:glycosyltransferase involved in cell wall biosynthesis
VLTDPADPAAIAAAVVELFADDARRERLTAAGRAHAASHDWPAVTQQYLAAYDAALTQ